MGSPGLIIHLTICLGQPSRKASDSALTITGWGCVITNEVFNNDFLNMARIDCTLIKMRGIHFVIISVVMGGNRTMLVRRLEVCIRTLWGAKVGLIMLQLTLKRIPKAGLTTARKTTQFSQAFLG